MKSAIIGAWIALLPFGLPASAGGEIYGEIETIRGETLAGPIRWDTNENFWSDLLDVAKQEVLAEEKEQGFRLSLFGLKIGGDSSVRRNSLSIPFGHIRSVERLSNDEALLVLKSGEEMEVQASTSDLGSRLRVVIDDKGRGDVELAWRSIAEVRFKPGPGEGRDRERLYATVHADGGEFEGFLIWDRDESLVGDVLDGEDEDGIDHEIAFGEIREIERLGPTRSRVTTKEGGSLILRGTNDVDDDNRGVVLGVTGLGRLEFEWSDVKKVVLREPPASRRYDSFDGGRRLSGTVQTADGKSFSGRLTWDRDESYTWESLDGWSEGLDYGVRFSHIAAIKRLDAASSEIKLRDGGKLVLSGTNDVDDDNRGVIVTAEGNTTIELDWAVIDRVEFD